MHYRTLGVVAFCVILAGCSGLPFGEDALRFESGETLVENSSLAEEGYERHYEETQTINETVSVGEGDGNETQVVIRNHMAQYGPESDRPAGIETVQLGVITTPAVRIAGRSLNPLLTGDHERVFRYLPETNSQGFEQYGNYTIEPFDEPVNVTVMATEAEAGETPEAFLHLMRAPHPDTGDTVIAYGLYPAEADAANSIARLFLSLEYTPPSEVADGDSTGDGNSAENGDGDSDAGGTPGGGSTGNGTSGGEPDGNGGSDGGFGPELPFSVQS
jgi:hypothetical protein